MNDRDQFDNIERVAVSCLGVIVYLILFGGCAVIALILRKLL